MSDLGKTGIRWKPEYHENESIQADGYDEHWVFKHCRIPQDMLQVI